MEDLEEIANESRINFVPCLKWVKRGVAKATPEKVQLTKEELIEAINKAKSDLQEANNVPESQDENDMTVDDEFNLENYDEETETTLEQFALHNVIQAPTEEDHFSDDDSDKEDDIIKTEDNLILVGRVDGDASILEVYIQNESEDSLYCHHDVFLPAFPLCIEWLDFEPGHPSGNYCAIGSMKPTIDIWDLDIENCLEPAYILGQKASRKKGLPHIGHTDAVLDISWNTNYHHVLASGSVDETILLWDIDEGKPSSKIEVFKEKVQCVKWHKLEGYTLLTGGCDKTARVFDCRSIDAFLKWDLSGEAERVAWSPLEPFVFFVGTNVGKIHAIDCRRGELWSLQAHEKEVTGMTISGQCPGLLVTASMDEKLKVWDFSAETVPSLVFEKDYALGNMHCLELCPDSPFIVAVGGDNKTHNFKVVDLQKIEEVNNRFGSRPLIKLELESEGQSST